MGKLIVLIAVLAGLYYIGSDGRARRQKEILDATSF